MFREWWKGCAGVGLDPAGCSLCLPLTHVPHLPYLMSLLQEKVTCLCTAKATLHETNEHHKSEEAAVARHFLVGCLLDDHVHPDPCRLCTCCMQTELSEADEKYRSLEEKQHMGTWVSRRVFRSPQVSRTCLAILTQDEVAALRSAQAELRQVSDRYHKLEDRVVGKRYLTSWLYSWQGLGAIVGKFRHARCAAVSVFSAPCACCKLLKVGGGHQPTPLPRVNIHDRILGSVMEPFEESFWRPPGILINKLSKPPFSGALLGILPDDRWPTSCDCCQQRASGSAGQGLVRRSAVAGVRV